MLAYSVYKVKTEDVMKELIPGFQGFDSKHFGQKFEFRLIDDRVTTKDGKLYLSSIAKRRYYKKNIECSLDKRRRLQVYYPSYSIQTEENLSKRAEAQIKQVFEMKFYTLANDKDITLTAFEKSPIMDISNFNLSNDDKERIEKLLSFSRRSLRVARMCQMAVELLLEQQYFNSNVIYEPVDSDTNTFKVYKQLERKVCERKFNY